MNLRVVQTIFLKEMKVMLRDKRTLIAMIGIPIILYPAMLIIVSQAAMLHISRVEESKSNVALMADDDARVTAWLVAAPMISVVDAEEPLQELLDGQLDAVVVVQGDVGEALAGGATVELEIEFDATEARSREAARRLSEALERVHENLLEGRLFDAGLSKEYVNPLELRETNIAPTKKTTGTLLGALLPVLIVVMLGVGAFYPAVDLTAGEKERGTFETLLSTPTSKFEIVSGKFLAVFSISLLTGLLNLASMTLTFLSQLRDFLEHLDPNYGGAMFDMAPRTVFFMVAIVVPLALFVSALMMSVAVFARTFKEAQNYLTPFFIAITIPAALSAMPGLKLSGITQFVPIVNVGLLFKDMLTEQAELSIVFSVFLTTTVYAGIALVFAAWLFQREEVILAEERGVSLSLRRSQFLPRRVPTLGMSLLLYAVCLLLIFYVGVYAQSKHFMSGILITEWGLILLPVLLYLWFARVNLVSALNLRLPSIGGLAGTLTLAVSWLLIVFQLGIWNNNVLPMPEEMAEQMAGLFQAEQASTGFWVLFFAIAVSPAICEEVLFRGAILSGLRKKLPPVALWLVVGGLFGLFHISVYRILLTGLTGIVLTYLVWRTRSIWTGMLAHVIVNGTVVLVATKHLPGPVLVLFEETSVGEDGGLPMWLLGCAVAVFLASIIILEMTQRRSPQDGQT